MKRTLLILFLILLVIIALPLITLLKWNFQAKKPIDIIIVDKTVPTLERENHKSFSWILKHERFVKKENNASYSYTDDYYGFSPKRPIKEKQWERNEYRLTDLINLAEKNDAVYFTDTYGVFFNDWYQGLNKSRRSRKLYGGLNNNDFLLIKEMKDRNKLIIMEYNSFDYPTAQFESVRTQEKLGISYSGWTGRYFTSLDSASKDFPIWMTAMYRKHVGKPWTFKNAGIVLLKERDILVLEEGVQLNDPMPHIITDSVFSQKYGLPSNVAFDKWFDIIDPIDNEVVSEFRIETTAAGDTLLGGYELYRKFPAVVRDSVTHRIYYFSGDFANNEIDYWTSSFSGIDKLKGILYSDKPDDTRRFFWLYYKPLINGILSEYYESMKTK